MGNAMHLAVIIGDHGDQWRRFPLAARSATRTVVFVDHRTSPRGRVTACREACDLSAVTVFERVESAPCPTDCAAGVHPWVRVAEGRFTIAGRCPECGLVELISDPLDLRTKELAQAN